MQSKAELRHHIISLKKRLSKREIVRQSRRVTFHLTRSSAYRKAKNVLFYASTAKEVQVQRLLREALREGKKAYLPVCKPRSMRLGIARVTSKTKVIRGPYGILQPRTPAGKRARVDLVLVPGLAFDRNGNRLGRGKGYYDRFLSRKSTKVMKVGLALSQQVLSRVPAGRKDVRMDLLATPYGIRDCRRRRKR